VLLLGLTLAVTGCATPGPVEIGPGMSFNQARRMLSADAWEPYNLYARGLARGEPEFTGVAKRLWTLGVVEVESCKADGASCVFNYRRGSQCTRLTTQGEALSEMKVTSVSADCPPTR
jgi:hypothetical protein